MDVNWKVTSSIVTILFLGILGFSQQVFAETNINSCQTLDIPEETYFLTADLTSDENCFIISAKALTLDGNGHSITGSTDGTGVIIASSMGTTVKNLEVTGFGVGIVVQSTSHSTILNHNNIHSNIGNGISIEFSNDNEIHRNIISQNGGDGVFGRITDGNKITENQFLSNVGNGLIFGSASDNNVVENNEANQNGKRGIFIFFSENNILKGNTANLNNWDGIYIVSSNGSFLKGNTANENGSSGIKIISSDGNTLSDNIANENNHQGIALSFSDKNTLNNNTVNHNKAMGIYLFFADFNFLNNNSSNENLVGIRQSHSFDNSLKANIAKENKDNGIDIFSGSRNTFENNTAEKNGKLGFRDFTKDFQDEVANDYFNNKCFSNAGGGSDPIGLCEPQKSNEPPSISIISPLDGSTFFEGDVVTLDGIANDPEEGIFDGIIEWTLNTFDVKIGIGTPIQVKDFSQGVHIITATVTDSRGLISFDSVEIEIKEKNAKMIIEDLESEVQESVNEGNMSRGSGNSLISSLEAVKFSIEKENLKSTCGQLQSITNKIKSQEGKKITPNQSQDLRNTVKKIESKLNCQ